MKIIVLSDIHNHVEHLEDAAGDISAADLVLICGDITNFGGRKKTKKIIKAIGKYNSNILGVTGNCDGPDAGGYLSDKGMNVNCSPVEFMGMTFAGLAGGMDESRPSFGDSLEEHFTNALAEIEKETAGKDPLVLVTHHPAAGTAVECRGGGSDAIFNFIVLRQPVLAVSGHIHEAFGKDTVGDCTLVNPGSFREGSYAEIEIDGGKVKNVKIHRLC